MPTKRAIVFGSTGHLGREIVSELVRQGYDTTAVVRNAERAKLIPEPSVSIRVADVRDPRGLQNICDGLPVVISALGKPVSPNDHSKPSFREIDLACNSYILTEAVKSRVEKFVYVSALHADLFSHLEYFRVHAEMEKKLRSSGLPYLIIRPPALFSSFLDLALMAKKGKLVNLGNGNHLTNPISEKDLAAILVQSLDRSNIILEAGGPEVVNRREINEIIQETVAPGKKIRIIPIGLVKAMLPLLKIFDRNRYDKFAFFTEVMQHDLLAPKLGKTSLKKYMMDKLS